MKDDTRLRRWIERISFLLIVGSVSALAFPKYESLEREKVAAQLLSDVEVLRTAVYRFYSDSAYFPEATPQDPAPDNLVAYLPPTFRFERPYGSLRYRNWPMRDTTTGTTAPHVVGVTVSVGDARIGAMAAAKAPQRTARFAVGNRYTFIFFGT